MEMKKFSDDYITKMSLRRVDAFGSSIHSFDFSFDGAHLYVANEESDLTISACDTGAKPYFLKLKKFGIDLLRSTRVPYAILHSAVNDDAIRYLPVNCNHYLGTFEGHTQKVTCLNVSPRDDTFISASLDGTFRYWDLNSPNCIGVCHIGTPPVTAFDNLGLVCAVGINSESINLYDVRALFKGPFETFKFTREENFNWTSLKFAPNGRTILINTNGDIVRLVDAFSGAPLQSFKNSFNNNELSVDVSYSPDSQYVVRGSNQSFVEAWNANTGFKIALLNSGLNGPVPFVQFNPKDLSLACGGENVSFLAPSAI